MAMTFIASQTISSNGSNPVFSSIPQNFTHLQVRVFGRGMANFSDGLSLYLQFNDNTTSTNYQNHGLFGNGSSVSSTNNLNVGTIAAQQIFPDSSATANYFGFAICDILDYTSTVKNKVVKVVGGYDKNGGGRAMIYSGVWMPSTPAAINKILVSTDNGFLSGSRIDLYGIYSANATGAQW
jgi:hypothetical protein